MNKAELAGMLIKPDTHERRVYEPLKADIFSFGFKLLLERNTVLDSGDIAFLYPKEVGHPKARMALTEYLAQKRTTLWALRLQNRPEIADATAYLQALKGDTEKTMGLRAKYNAITITPEDYLNKTPAYFQFLMINNFHVFDDFDFFLEFLSRKNISGNF